MGICFLLCAAKLYLYKIQFTRWHYLLFLYALWVLAKTIAGYFVFGPLSLRNAALFYYPFFAVMALYFYRQELCTRRSAELILLACLIIKLTVGFNECFILPIFAGMLFLTAQLRSTGLKLLVLVALIILFPFHNFFQLTKSSLIGHMLAITFLSSYLFFLVQLTRWQKWLFVFIAVGCVAYGFLRFAERGQLTALTNPGNAWATFKFYDEYIKEHQKSYVPQTLDVKVFNETRGRPSEILVRLHWESQTATMLRQTEVTKKDLNYMRREVEKKN